MKPSSPIKPWFKARTWSQVGVGAVLGVLGPVAAVYAQNQAPIPATQPGTTPGAVPGLVTPAEANPQGATLAELLKTLRNPQADANVRVQAVGRLYESGDPAARNQLRLELATSPDPVVPWAILRGVALSSQGAAPPREWVAVLTDLLASAEEPLLSELSLTLSRYNDPATLSGVSALALDPRLPQPARVAAINALSVERSRNATATLMQLIEPLQPATVRNAAYNGLIRITGQSNLGYDQARWQQWWLTHRDLSAEQWQRLIFDNLDQQRDQLINQLRQTELRLVESQRSLYRNSTADKRPALLTAMLGDTVEAVRLLGMSLCELAVGEAGPTMATPELRQALLATMDDQLPELRQRATLVLRDLAEPAAADKAAAVLQLEQEKRPELLRAYLLLLTRMPRTAAVQPVIQFLQQSQLQREAAEFLTTSSLSANAMLNPAQQASVLQATRSAVINSESPEPALVRLLAKVGEENDWQYLQGLLDHREPVVRRTAARLLAESTRSLWPLVQRLKELPTGERDELYAVLLEGVLTRGNAPEQSTQPGESGVMWFLVEQRPTDTALSERWERALVNLAGRESATMVLRVDERLLTDGVGPELRLRVLTAAIDRLFPGATAGVTSNGNTNANGNAGASVTHDTSKWSLAQAQTAGALLLARAQLHAGEKQWRPALSDALKIERHQLQGSITLQERRQWALLVTQGKLMLADYDLLGSYAKLVTAAPAGAPVDTSAENTATSDPMVNELVTLFLQAAQKQLPDKPERARALILVMQEALPGALPQVHRATLAELEKVIGPVQAVTPAPLPPATANHVSPETVDPRP